MRRLRLWRRILIVLASIVIALAALPAAHAQQTFSHGAVVALEGTPHLWIADAQGVLHWGGDTRALAGKHVNWNDRTEVTVAQLRALPVGDPWLSAGLLKDGDPIYLVKWESDWARPQLFHIQSIADVELFGIDGSNYGRFVLDRATWEARYGISAASLQRSALPAAVTIAIATPTPIPRPTIDPRLQDALNMIEETTPGSVYGEHGTVTVKNPQIVFGHIGKNLGLYHIPTNTITVSETMRNQPLEVIAYILVHEMSHARQPWTKYGAWTEGADAEVLDYCFNNEHFAEWGAALWWDTRYGKAGHPDTNNARVRHANYAAWLRRQDLSDYEDKGKFGNRFNTFMREVLKDYCKLEETAAPAPTPTPTPSPTPVPQSAPVPIPGTATIEEVVQFMNSYDEFALHAQAEWWRLRGHSGNNLDRILAMVFPLNNRLVHAMPTVYSLYTWSEYAFETYPDTWEFAKSYMWGYSQHYIHIAYRWLESDPCTWPEVARDYMFEYEKANPGRVRGVIESLLLADIRVRNNFNHYHPNYARAEAKEERADYYYERIVQEAKEEYSENPETYLNQFRCAA